MYAKVEPGPGHELTTTMQDQNNRVVDEAKANADRIAGQVCHGPNCNGTRATMGRLIPEFGAEMGDRARACAAGGGGAGVPTVSTDSPAWLPDHRHWFCSDFCALKRELANTLTANQGPLKAAAIVPSFMDADTLAAVTQAFEGLRVLLNARERGAADEKNAACIEDAISVLTTYVQLHDSDADFADIDVAAAASQSWSKMAALIAAWREKSQTLPRMVRKIGGGEAACGGC